MHAFIKKLNELNASRRAAYRSAPRDLDEHAGTEEVVLAGGYGYRQILELVQNGADAILEASQERPELSVQGRIQVALKGAHLYVANTGAPLSEEGLQALLSSHTSSKRGNQIGRFGLGFKSLLKLKGQIDIFTRSNGALRFDPVRCRTELQQEFSVKRAPGLRLAWPLSDHERESDPVCIEMSWAETIVRASIEAEELRSIVRDEIASFPAEFLLFFPVPVSLTLDDGESRRDLMMSRDDDRYVLRDGETKSCWRVFTRNVTITDRKALEDATGLHARDTTPIAWAMPLTARREEAGRFWAFFPTQTQTFMPGIINSPWKLNSDRNAIIGGEWNSALMREAASLIVDSLSALIEPDDPGRVVDAFPRQTDKRDEVATPLVNAVWEGLEQAPVVPDGTGAPRLAYELLRHPTETLNLIQDWQVLASPERLGAFVHATCMDKQRASRLKSLAIRLEKQRDHFAEEEQPLLGECAEQDWFSDIASDKVETARRVLKLVCDYSQDVKPSEWATTAPQLRVILGHDGRLLKPTEALLEPPETTVPGRTAVAPALQADPECQQILAGVLRVRKLDNAEWHAVLEENMRRPFGYGTMEDQRWIRFWETLRLAPPAAQSEFLCTHSMEVRVRRRDSKWMRVHEVLLPGELVASNDTTPNANVLVDPMFHVDDVSLLEILGVRAVPEGLVELGEDEVRVSLSDWRDFCRTRYKETHLNSANKDYLWPLDLALPAGYLLLSVLTGGPRARLSLILTRWLGSRPIIRPVPFGRKTSKRFAQIEVANPLAWLLLKHGEVQVGGRTALLRAIVRRADKVPSERIDGWGAIHSSMAAFRDAVPTEHGTPRDFQAMWAALLDTHCETGDTIDPAFTALCANAAQDNFVPKTIQTKTGQLALSKVLTTSSSDLARHALAAGHTVVVLDAETKSRWLDAGAGDLSEHLDAEWDPNPGPDEQLSGVIPELEEVLHPAYRLAACCQRVTGLRLRIARDSSAVACLMWDGRLLVDTERLRERPRAERLRIVLEELQAAGWLATSAQQALDRLGDSGLEKRRAFVAGAADLPARLLRAVGNRVEPLLGAIGMDLSTLACVGTAKPEQIADLALKVLGPTTLVSLKDVLDGEGLRPPGRWNSSEARAFVAEVGFPSEFALGTTSRRDSEEIVSGPIALPELHPYQKEVLEGLSAIINGGSGRRRAVVCLPTGSGKTRVSAEAAVRLVLAPPGSNRSVVWIAQTDELCEQAVQAFKQVWSNVGEQRTDLRIVRLWGGTRVPQQQQLDRPLVVVASIQTLTRRIDIEGIAWLNEPALVVVDECHHAIAPSYTRMLRWLDAEPVKAGTAPKKEPAIIGLSATPFRTDEDESRRLAKRFDGRWLPADQEHLTQRLLALRVLSEPRYEALQSVSALTDDELSRLSRLKEPWEGLELDNLLEAINHRLALDDRRNSQIVEFLQQSTERSVLLFANSAKHSTEMAVRLNLAGVCAAAVSADTPTSARRWFLDRFQSGEIRVLCNHSVLTTGFDAPRTDMVLISRQVFSAVRYMQMVGRGLRGVNNGGTESCRIVTVMDNLGRFGERHPYHYAKRYY